MRQSYSNGESAMASNLKVDTLPVSKRDLAEDDVVLLYADGLLLNGALQYGGRDNGFARRPATVPELAAHVRTVLRAYVNGRNDGGNGALLAPLQRRFEVIARTNPGATAVRFNGRALTYGELDEQADELALFLQRDGLLPGSFCLLKLEPSLAQVRAILAVLKAGAAFLQCSPSLPREPMAVVLAVFRPALTFVRADADGEGESLRNATRTIRCHEEAAPLPYGWPDETAVDAGTLAQVFAGLSDRGCLCVSVRTHQAISAQVEKGAGDRAAVGPDPVSFWRHLSAGTPLTIAPCA
jgi:non-ribosomal peptide synthetase component F